MEDIANVAMLLVQDRLGRYAEVCPHVILFYYKSFNNMGMKKALNCPPWYLNVILSCKDVPIWCLSFPWSILSQLACDFATSCFPYCAQRGNSLRWMRLKHVAIWNDWPCRSSYFALCSMLNVKYSIFLC